MMVEMHKRYSGIEGLAEFPPLRIPEGYIPQLGGEWRMCGTGPEDGGIFALNAGEEPCGGAGLPDGYKFLDGRETADNPMCCDDDGQEVRVGARAVGQLWLPGFNTDPLSDHFGEKNCLGIIHHCLCPGNFFECEITLTPDELERMFPRAPESSDEGVGDA